jgi:hypothetical protein
LAGVLTLFLCAGVVLAQTARPDPKTAAVPVMKQLEAFRRGDPEIARSTFGAVVKTELPAEGLAYVTVKIRGANGQSVEALYELTWEDDWKINGVVTRPDAGVI